MINLDNQLSSFMKSKIQHTTAVHEPDSFLFANASTRSFVMLIQGGFSAFYLS